VTKNVDSILSGWPDWPLPLTGSPLVKARLSAGRTNQSYRLDAPGLDDDLLLRLHRPDAHRLGIDRERELIVTRRAAEAGIGRPVWHWTKGYSIFPFIEARTWTEADVAHRARREQIWPLVERLAALDIEQPRMRYSNYLHHYWEQLGERTTPERSLRRAWAGFWPELLAFDSADWTAGLVHHDLTPGNVLDTGDRLVLIDWEYAAMGHPDIDRWTVDPRSIEEPFIGELMRWINALWARLV